MANTVAPFGFKPIRRLDGAAWTSAHTTRKMQNNAGPLNRGDLVQALADGTVAVSAAALGHLTVGVYVGCHYLSAALGYPIWSNYWPGAGALGLVDVFILDDPFLVFEVQASAGPITLADIGSNADVVVAASTTGFSKWSLGAPTTTASTNFPFKIVGLGNFGVNTQDGYDVASANNIVEVTWNDMFNKGPAIGI
jgi:hypothetical protein